MRAFTLPEFDDTSRSEVSRLIESAQHGDGDAWNDLLSIVYDELRSLASLRFNGRPVGHTLQPTALVHEAWLKLAGHLDSMQGRRHFLAVAAKAMRQVLADHARAAGRQKRGGHQHTIALNTDAAADESDVVDLLSLNDAFDRLAELDARAARVVELRLLGAMTIPEIAETLDVAPRTVDSDWSFARAWLRRELSGD